MSLHVERGGAGPDLVLLHGWGLNSRVWEAALAGLESTHRVHRVDLPGHGGSTGAGFGSLEDAADQVAGVVPDGARICGWSLGALVAVALALRQPRKARALVLVGATPCFAARPDWPHGMPPETFEAFADAVRAEPGQALARFARLNALNGANAREAARKLEACARASPATAGSLEAGLRVLREADLRPEVARLEQPTVLLHGARDAVSSIGSGRWLVSAVPGARLVEIEDAAHVPFLTHVPAFRAAVDSLHG